MPTLPHHAAVLFLLVGGVALSGCGSKAEREAVRGEAPAAYKARADTAGNWAVLAIDDRPVAPDEFRVSLWGGEVTGGRDGCNNWGYVEGNRTEPDGSRMIVSDAQGCPETSQSRAYRSVLVRPEVQRVGRDRLLLSGRGHSLLVVRCEWQTVVEERAGYSSQMRQCRPGVPG